MSVVPLRFPDLCIDYILSFQFSSWYPKFSHVSIRSTVIRPLSREFLDYLKSDGVFIPDGSEDLPVQSALSDNEDADDADASDDAELPRFAFPDLDAQIRQCVKEYGAVFPKLNFSSPKDAFWMLPASSPLKCTSPSDVYLLLESSDFISHDITRELVFEGCDYSTSSTPPYDLELVLRKWYPMDRSRELRCFVREDVLLGISQRDSNYFDFWNEAEIKDSTTLVVNQFWETHVKGKWHNSGDYVFDILLTRDLSRAFILDFNPYAPRTDPLLFTYDELLSLFTGDRAALPQLRVIDSRTHPIANQNAPTYQHNMIPLETLSLSSGRDIESFAAAYQDEIKKSIEDK